MNNKIWRNFINKPKLGNHVSSPIEVGYSQYGPTFAVSGTLTALTSVVLVHNVCVEIRSLTDKSYRYMDWFAFRPPHHEMGKFSELDLTMCSKFTLSPEHAVEYNIIFADSGRYSEMKSLLKAIKDAWEDVLVGAAKLGQAVNHEALFQEFTKLQLTTDAIGRLKTLNSWRSGDYQLKVRVITENPKQVFDVEKKFALTPENQQSLEHNAALIIADICQQTKITYYCATPAPS